MSYNLLADTANIIADEVQFVTIDSIELLKSSWLRKVGAMIPIAWPIVAITFSLYLIQTGDFYREGGKDGPYVPMGFWSTVLGGDYIAGDVGVWITLLFCLNTILLIGATLFALIGTFSGMLDVLTVMKQYTAIMFSLLVSAALIFMFPAFSFKTSSVGDLDSGQADKDYKVKFRMVNNNDFRHSVSSYIIFTCFVLSVFSMWPLAWWTAPFVACKKRKPHSN